MSLIDPKDSATLTYRPHLDGLRAVAVLLVFIFHANGSFLRGGFIGVDVFFVLSGYLITRVMLGRADTGGGLRLRDFYARRVRRLLPAMLLVVAAVTIREAIWGSIVEVGTRLREIVATLLYVANWNLVAQADDYFAETASVSPLRHAWSLAVEEQFYLLFPLVLIAALALGRRRHWRTPAALGALAAVSAITMALLYSPLTVNRAYYGTDTRAHQLLIGAVVGYAFHRRRELIDRLRSPLTAAAAPVALIGLFALAVVSSGQSGFYFVGGSTVVALVTVVLVASLEAMPDTAAGRLLSTPPAVALGKISYGFYLWHWPIIIWLAAPATASFLERRWYNAAQLTITVAAATASYLLVEMPIRERRWLFGRLTARQTIALGVGVSALAAVGAVAVLRSPATPPIVAASSSEAFSSPGADFPETTEAAAPDPGTTTTASAPLDEAAIAAQALADKSVRACPETPRPCVKVEAPAGAPTVAMIGDSTAQAYGPGMEELAAEHGYRYVQAAVGGCPISHRLLATGGNGELHKPSNFMCFEELPSIYEELLDVWSPQLIIATSWNETNKHVEDGRLIEADTPEHYAAVADALRETLAVLTSRGAQVVLIDVLPPGPAVTCLETSAPNEGTCVRPTLPDSREKAYNAIFHAVADEMPDVHAISVTDVLCPDEACPLLVDGTVVRYDGGHFTGTASRRLAPVIADKLAQIGILLSSL